MSNFFVKAYFQRLESGSQSAIYLAFIVVVLFIFLVIKIISYMVKLLLLFQDSSAGNASLSCCFYQKRNENIRDIYKEFKVGFLEAIYKKAIEERNTFKNNMQSSDFKASFKSRQFRYDEENECMDESIMARLETRVTQIEKVIDDHLRDLHGSKGLKYFEDFDYDEKLRYLLEMAAEFNNRDRMRIINIIQSYDIFLSHQFRNTQIVRNLIEKNRRYQLIHSKEEQDRTEKDMEDNDDDGPNLWEEQREPEQDKSGNGKSKRIENENDNGGEDEDQKGKGDAEVAADADADHDA